MYIKTPTLSFCVLSTPLGIVSVRWLEVDLLRLHVIKQAIWWNTALHIWTKEKDCVVERSRGRRMDEASMRGKNGWDDATHNAADRSWWSRQLGGWGQWGPDGVVLVLPELTPELSLNELSIELQQLLPTSTCIYYHCNHQSLTGAGCDNQWAP